MRTATSFRAHPRVLSPFRTDSNTLAVLDQPSYRDRADDASAWAANSAARVLSSHGRSHRFESCAAHTRPRCNAGLHRGFFVQHGNAISGDKQLLIAAGNSAQLCVPKKFLDLPVVRIIPSKTRNTTETWALLKASRPSTAPPNWPLPVMSESGLLKALLFRRAKNRPQA